MELCTDQAVIGGYLTDASNLKGHAEALVRPRTASEVAEVMRRCQADGIPLTITAKRTSTTGAPVPQGGWLLSTERMTAVCDIGKETARVSAGSLLGDFQERVEEQGWYFPPDPTSRWDCSVGGAISCNASGARSFHYGPTRDWVQSVEVVLPTGEIRSVDRSTAIPEGWVLPDWDGPTGKNTAGYFRAENLLDLLIGSEGTLGVITEATVRLTRRPGQLLGLLLFFEDSAGVLRAVEGVRGAKRAGDVDCAPLCVEYFDAASLALIRDRVAGIPHAARAALYLEQPYADEAPIELWMDRVTSWSTLADHTLVASDRARRAQVHSARHAVPAAINERLVRHGQRKIATDFAVPDHGLEEMLQLYEEEELAHATFGHIGDNHLHCNFLPTTEEEAALARQAYTRLAAHAVALGGTISAEHGIGKLKKASLALMVPQSVLQAFRALKRTADPAWILGRGNVLDPV